MEILTLKGIGKSKLLTRLLRQCLPENCLITVIQLALYPAKNKMKL